LLAGLVAPLPALVAVHASHAPVTPITKTGDYSSWMALWNTLVQLFFVPIWEARIEKIPSSFSARLKLP
jgi:hypothetical protein